jgi:hypothetical protein
MFVISNARNDDGVATRSCATARKEKFVLASGASAESAEPRALDASVIPHGDHGAVDNRCKGLTSQPWDPAEATTLRRQSLKCIAQFSALRSRQPAEVISRRPAERTALETALRGDRMRKGGRRGQV